MLHGVGTGIRCGLSLRRVGAFWLSICARGGAVLLASGRLRLVVHPEMGGVVVGPQCGAEV